MPPLWNTLKVHKYMAQSMQSTMQLKLARSTWIPFKESHLTNSIFSKTQWLKKPSHHLSQTFGENSIQLWPIPCNRVSVLSSYIHVNPQEKLRNLANSCSLINGWSSSYWSFAGRILKKVITKPKALCLVAWKSHIVGAWPGFAIVIVWPNITTRWRVAARSTQKSVSVCG